MAVHDAPGPDPLGEQRRAPGGEPAGEPFDLPQARLLQQVPAAGPGPPDIGLPARLERLLAPAVAICGPRGAAACQAASTRATWRSARSTGACAVTSVDSRRAAGIRRITTRWSQTRPRGSRISATPR